MEFYINDMKKDVKTIDSLISNTEKRGKYWKELIKIKEKEVTLYKIYLDETNKISEELKTLKQSVE